MYEEWDELLGDGRALGAVLAAVHQDLCPLDEWVQDYMNDHGLARNIVVRESGLNQTFAYQILNGSRRASRDKLIQLAFGMSLGAADACELLERGGSDRLAVTRRRDVVIAWCLERGKDLSICDDILWGMGEETVTGESTHRHSAGS